MVTSPTRGGDSRIKFVQDFWGPVSPGADLEPILLGGDIPARYSHGVDRLNSCSSREVPRSFSHALHASPALGERASKKLE